MEVDYALISLFVIDHSCLMRPSSMSEFVVRGILFCSNVIILTPHDHHGVSKSSAHRWLAQQHCEQPRKYPNSPTENEIVSYKLLLFLWEYLYKALSLQWSHVSAMTAQITNRSTVCSSAFSGSQERRHPNFPTGDEIICNSKKKTFMILWGYLWAAFSLQ